MQPNPLQQVKIIEQDDNKNLSAEAKELLTILDELENFTAKLRKRIVSELKPDGSNPQD